MLAAAGVKPRMAPSRSRKIVAICVERRRFSRSALALARAWFRGLHLFLRGFQLLVRRLQLLVHGEELLVGGFQLLVGGLQILDRALQILAGAQKLALQALDQRVGVRMGRHGRILAPAQRSAVVLEDDHVETVLVPELGHRLHGDPHRLQPFRGVDRRHLARHRAPGADRLVEGGAQAHAQAAAHHAHDVVGEAPRRRLDVDVDAFREEDDLALLGDNGVFRRELVEQDALRDGAEIHVVGGVHGPPAGSVAAPNSPQRPRHVELRFLALRDAVLGVDDAEELVVAGQALGGARGRDSRPGRSA
jgi:hypothetical protein